MVIIDALHDVSRHSCIKETDGKFHQFDEKIWNNGNIDPCRKMKYYPTSDNFYAHSTYKKHNLSQQNQINKIEILILNPNIYNTLGKEWKNKRKQTPC